MQPVQPCDPRCSLCSHMCTHMHTFKRNGCRVLPPNPPPNPLAVHKAIYLIKLNFWKTESEGFWWITITDRSGLECFVMTFSPEDFSPALSPGARSMYEYVATAKRRRLSAKVPRFPGTVTEVYITAEASAVEPRCRRDTCRRQPDGAPPAGTTRGLHLDRVGGKNEGMSGETRREMMSNAHTLWGKKQTKLQDDSLLQRGWNRIKNGSVNSSE